jgi:urea transport system substrate-binding protein
MPVFVLKSVAVLLLILLAIGLGLAWHRHEQTRLAEPIPVGILHSLTGTMAISERGVVAATRLAIDEINAAGGLLGRPVQTIVRNGASDWATFAREAESLILDAEVEVVFGCWTSASRKTVKPVFEQHDHLLFYPVQYEGLELSPNIVYTGAAPNQQIIPAVKWAMDNLGRRFFLVGSDYVFPMQPTPSCATRSARCADPWSASTMCYWVVPRSSRWWRPSRRAVRT